MLIMIVSRLCHLMPKLLSMGSNDLHNPAPTYCNLFSPAPILQPATPVYKTSLNPLCTGYHAFVGIPVLIWQALIYPLRASSNQMSPL